MKRSLLVLTALALVLTQPLDTQPDLGVPSPQRPRRVHLLAGVRRRRVGAGARRQRRRRRGRDGVRAGRHAPERGQHRRRRLHDRPHARTASVTTFDYREKAPLKSTRTMYLGADGKIDISLTSAGYLAPGVPGTVRGLELAHKKFGKLPWKDVVMPGVAARRAGLRAVGRARARPEPRARRRDGRRSPRRSRRTASPAAASGRAGDRLVLADLGKTLRAIATGRPRRLLQGLDRGSHRRRHEGERRPDHAGRISRRTRRRSARRCAARYRGYEIVSMPPPSSGGVALIEMLNILEPYDLKSKGLLTAPALHLADRSDAPRLPRSRALSRRSRFRQGPGRAADVEGRTRRAVASTIDPAKASSSVELGKDIVTAATATEPDETTHFSVIDRRRHGGLEHLHARGRLRLARRRQGRGVPPEQRDGGLQQEAGRHEPDRRHRHAGEPDRSRQADAQLDDADDRARRTARSCCVTGSPGGRTIINTVLTVVLGVTEYGLTGREAVDLPRMHHQWLPDAARRSSESARRRASAEAVGDDVLDAHARWATTCARAERRGTRTRSGSRPTARPTASTTSAARIRRRRSPSHLTVADRRTIGLRTMFRAQHHHRHHHHSCSGGPVGLHAY